MKKIAVIGANEPLEPFFKQVKALGYYIVGIAYEKVPYVRNIVINSIQFHLRIKMPFWRFVNRKK